MERIEKTVFLSYRRTNIPWALAIFQNLTEHGYDVFFDYDGLASGDFEKVILGNITARAHFVVLLTPSALERCGDPSDWLRREIEAALEHQRNVVPLMLDGFDFGTPAIAKQLTGTLGPLRDYNALNIPPEYFSEAMERLRSKFLNVPLDAVLHPVSVSAQRAATVQKAAAVKAPTVQEQELTAQQWFERGFEASDLDESLRFYSQAIRIKPDYALAFFNRGVTREDKGDREGALRDYAKAIKLKFDFVEAFNNRGLLRHKESDLEGAQHDFTEAIRLNCKFAEAFYNRGNVRRDRGDLEGALRDFDEAIRLKPDYPAVFYNRGLARGTKGDAAGELKDYNEAIRLKPDYAEAFYNRGIMRYLNGELDAALADYDAAIRLNATYAFNNRGLARFDKGDREGALLDYNEAIRVDPSNARAFSNRGKLRRENGDLEGAQQDFDEAIRLGYTP